VITRASALSSIRSPCSGHSDPDIVILFVLPTGPGSNCCEFCPTNARRFSSSAAQGRICSPRCSLVRSQARRHKHWTSRRHVRHIRGVRIGAIMLALGAMWSAGVASAHPGGLNASGCHNNRKTGEYHCHRGGGTSSPPVRRQPQTERFLSGGGGAVYYPNCASARAAGVAPLRVGDAGYRPGLDRDGDGKACE